MRLKSAQLLVLAVALGLTGIAVAAVYWAARPQPVTVIGTLESRSESATTGHELQLIVPGAPGDPFIKLTLAVDPQAPVTFQDGNVLPYERTVDQDQDLNGWVIASVVKSRDGGGKVISAAVVRDQSAQDHPWEVWQRNKDDGLTFVDSRVRSFRGKLGVWGEVDEFPWGNATYVYVMRSKPFLGLHAVWEHDIVVDDSTVIVRPGSQPLPALENLTDYRYSEVDVRYRLYGDSVPVAKEIVIR